MMRKLAPFQPEVQAGQMSEGRFLASRASRKAKRREKESQKAEKKRTKAETKKENKERRAKTISNIASSFGGVVSSIFGKPVPGGETAPEEELPGTEIPEKKSLLSNPLVWIAGVGLVAGGIYFATRKRSA